MGERLLAIDVLSTLESQHGGKGVRVLTGADDYRIELFCLIENFAEVVKFFGFGMPGSGGIEVVGIHIAQGDDILRGNAGEITAPSATGANDGYVQFIIQILAPQEGRS
jgi:hypothetical protein